MRLLFVHDRFGAMAGAEVNIWLTAGELKRRGRHIGILHGPGTGKSEAGWCGLFPDRFALDAPKKALAIRAAIASFQPDVIYIHKISDLAVLETLQQTGVPIVRMVHDHDLYCMRSYRYFPLTRTICTRAASPYCIFPCGANLARNRNGPLPFKWISYLAKRKEIRLNQRFQRMVVASDYMKQQLLRNGFAPERVEMHAPVPQTTEALGESSFSARNLIIYAGQIIRGKGVDLLVKSLAEVRVHFECVIIGEGSHRSACEALSRKLGLQDRVFFNGYVPSEQLPRYYADASVAVMSSVWPEPFGAVGLEAMRYGLPVVAFDAGGMSGWLHNGQNGFLVPVKNCMLFARRLEELLANKALARQMGARGRQMVRERFHFGRYVSGLENMFAQVIEEARGPNEQGARGLTDQEIKGPRDETARTSARQPAEEQSISPLVP